MAIELILLEDVANLGKIGDKVKVSDGYARNYLLPRNLAAKVTPGVLRALEAKKVRLQAQDEENKNIAAALAAKIAGLTLTISVRADDDGRLFGSVNVPQILEALTAAGCEVAKTAVILPEPIKALGESTVAVELHPEVKTSVKVSVVRG